VISPLMLNVALHGLEEAAGVRYYQTGNYAGQSKLGSPMLVRYADLCRVRHKSAYVERRIMPTGASGVLVSEVVAARWSA
jgi:RNA-directed DNA polymerase